MRNAFFALKAAIWRAAGTDLRFAATLHCARTRARRCAPATLADDIGARDHRPPNPPREGRWSWSSWMADCATKAPFATEGCTVREN